MTSVSAAEFNQHPSRAKRQAANSPVVITERNRPAFVLMTFAEYERLAGAPTNLAVALEMADEVDFDIPETGVNIRPAQL
jgi:prevent-host-death family protein